MRPAARFSLLQTQLPLAAVALFVVLAGAITLVSQREVARQARELAGSRLAQVAQQIATTTRTGVEQARGPITTVAASPAVAALLQAPSAQRAAAARRALAPLVPSDDSLVGVRVWSAGVDRPLLAMGYADPAELIRPDVPAGVAMGPIQARDDSSLYFSVTAPIQIDGLPAGVLERRQPVARSAQSVQLVETLVGTGGRILFGVRDGVWADAGRRAEPPPAQAIGAGTPVTYERMGARQIGIARPVEGTPWLVLAEIPEREALAPTRGFLRRLGLIALVLVAGTGLVAVVAGRRITQPLRGLYDAAEAIAAGDRGQRAEITGHREVQRLAVAFNSMAEESERHLRAVTEREERFRSLVTATAQIVWWTGPTGDIVDRIPTWQAFTGQSFEELKGSGWVRAVHPDDVPAVSRVWDEARRHRSIFEMEYRIRRHDGEYRRLLARGVPVLERDGSVREWVGTGTDVTDQREAAALLERKNFELRQAQRLEAVGRLAGGIAHDFNNVLAIVISAAELARSELPTDHRARRDIDDIQTAAQGAADLTRRLLVLGRQQVVDPEVLDVSHVVTEAARLLGRVIGESITLELALHPNAQVRLDRGQLEQVITNLVVNARDAMPTGGRLTIETAMVELTEKATEAHADGRPGSYVLLAVSDTGQGMDDQVRQHLFEPFFTTKEPGKGTGLGLATVYGIVKQAGGHIWVYSEPGVGSVFKVYFPSSDRTAAESGSSDNGELARAGGETVLLAEDEPRLLALTERALQKLGYQVLSAGSGGAALELARDPAARIDALVTDVVMPQMSGLELLERVRELRPGLPVLFLSGWATDAVVRHGILEGQVPFLQKPFTVNELGRKLREVLDGHRGTAA